MADANTEKAESIIRKLRRRLYRALGIKRHKWAYERQPLVDLTRLLGGDFRRSPFESPIDLRRDLARYGIVARGIIHVGAHRGTEVDLYRAMGFQDVLFVEANPQLIPDLQALASRSPGVRIAHAAITDHNGSVRLRLTSMDQSSSILPSSITAKSTPEFEKLVSRKYLHERLTSSLLTWAWTRVASMFSRWTNRVLNCKRFAVPRTF